jgi:hypothetical protein
MPSKENRSVKDIEQKENGSLFSSIAMTITTTSKNKPSTKYPTKIVPDIPRAQTVSCILPNNTNRLRVPV